MEARRKRKRTPLDTVRALVAVEFPDTIEALIALLAVKF